MTYTLNAPNPNDSPAAQQPALSTNTNLVNTYFGTDHVTFTEASDQGEHLKVTLNDVQPDPALVSPKSQLYSKTVSGQEQLFFANASNVYQVTPPNLSSLTVLAKCSTNNTGANMTFLPGQFNFQLPIVFTSPNQYRFDFATPLTPTQEDNAKVFITVRTGPNNLIFNWDLTDTHITIRLYQASNGSPAGIPNVSTPYGINILVIE